MNELPDPAVLTEAEVLQVDVLIVGAGISGIDAAYHLQRRHPDKRFAILERQETFGGTWHTHKFPGIRTDSDLFTFGFKWKPWTGVPIATADQILRYLGEAIAENDLDQHIRYGQEVVSAAWSSETARWHLQIEERASGRRWSVQAGFLWMAAGYYDHDQGYAPRWPDMERFEGPIVHPQHWPDDLDLTDKKVAVIGSGATAATLIPAITEVAQHVTMVQRSPTYYFPRPNTDDFTETLRALDLPDEWFHEIMRRRFLHESQNMRRRTLEEPDAVAAELIAAARAHLGPGYDVATHFTPRYKPWRQRVALIPEGDFFQAIRRGDASVVTDTIARFTERGIEMSSGERVEADVIVSATGLTLKALGGIAFAVDGQPVEQKDCWTHRGVMLTGLPNMVNVFGYLRSSWTLRADLVSDYVCRLMDHMADIGARQVTAELRPEDRGMNARPYIDPENFNAGYILRGLPIMPKQGDKQPWLMTQDYFSDRETLPAADLEDGTLIYR